MGHEEMSARRIDTIRAKVAPLIMHEPHFETVAALMMLASHTAVHDGATEDDFLAMARAMYRRSIDVHRDGCVAR